jgi:hypothetical protein
MSSGGKQVESLVKKAGNMPAPKLEKEGILVEICELNDMWVPMGSQFG